MKTWKPLILGAILAVLAPPFMNGQTVQQAGLDEVIQSASKRVEEGMPQGTMIAVLNFTSTSEAFSDYVVEELTGELVRGRKLTIVDRRRLALIRQEMNLQLSGEVSDESASAIGRQLGAQSIVSGSLTNLGTYFRFRVSVINVETSAIEYQISLNLRSDPQVTFLLDSDSQKTTPATPASTTQTVRAGTASTVRSATSEPVVYKVGDRGPAGGIIFYDKGNNSDSWRYLEAAPADKEFKAQWGAYRTNVRETGVAVGTGKANAQRIIPVLDELGETSRAARLCILLNINGYTDWFLPSKGELDWMYTNLKMKGLGGFSGDRYWSSSQESNQSVWAHNFSDGKQDSRYKTDNLSVRAIRQF